MFKQENFEIKLRGHVNPSKLQEFMKKARKPKVMSVEDLSELLSGKEMVAVSILNHKTPEMDMTKIEVRVFNLIKIIS